MPRPGGDLRRRGRRGRRTPLMVQAARSRIDDLFGLAGVEAARGTANLPDRYVRLARLVGTRYNVRLPREYRELYCRGCSSYWTEGRTVRTRLRGPVRVRTCLVCGRIRRMRVRAGRTRRPVVDSLLESAVPADQALVEDGSDLEEELEELRAEEGE